MTKFRREDDLRSDQLQDVYEFLGKERTLFLYGDIVSFPIRNDTFCSAYIADAIIAMNAATECGRMNVYHLSKVAI